MLFLRNSYMEAIELIAAKAGDHFIYSQGMFVGIVLTADFALRTGHANFTILKAIVTLDPEEIEYALQQCQSALVACHEGRRKVNWIASWFWRTDPNDYTDGIGVPASVVDG